MAPSIRQDLQAGRRKGCTFFLAFFWIFGILYGIWISRCAGDPFLFLMRTAVNSSVSIVGLLLTATLPFLLSAIAVFTSGPGWFLPLSFWDGFLYGYVCLAVMRAYASAGWLIRPILCFSISISAPLVYFFRLRHIRRKGKPSIVESCFFLSCALLIGSIDYAFVSPFLASLIF